jgi:hypothetical protein
MQIERIFVGILLLAGFLWLRHRARKLGEGDRSRAMRGGFLFLVPMLIGGRWLFEKLPYGSQANLAIELVGLVAVFAVTGYVFMAPGRGED